MKVELKKIAKDDLGILMEWRMKPEITKYMYTDPILNMEKQLEWYKKISNNEKCKYWVIYCDDIKIGNMFLQNIDYVNKKCSWAYYIGDNFFRGKGLGKILECNIYDYVFTYLKLNKLCCEVLSFNEKVIGLHKKFGSEIEGVLKENIFKNNVYHDVVVMGITKKKWELISGDFEYDKIHIE